MSSEVKSERPPSAQGPAFKRTQYVQRTPREPKDLCKPAIAGVTQLRC